MKCFCNFRISFSHPVRFFVWFFCQRSSKWGRDRTKYTSQVTPISSTLFDRIIWSTYLIDWFSEPFLSTSLINLCYRLNWSTFWLILWSTEPISYAQFIDSNSVKNPINLQSLVNVNNIYCTIWMQIKTRQLRIGEFARQDQKIRPKITLSTKYFDRFWKRNKIYT